MHATSRPSRAQASTFELLDSDRLAPLLLHDEDEDEGEGNEAEEGRRPPAGGGKGGCPHCAHKLHVKFVDMLTYPRPIRKFEVRLRVGLAVG